MKLNLSAGNMWMNSVYRASGEADWEPWCTSLIRFLIKLFIETLIKVSADMNTFELIDF